MIHFSDFTYAYPEQSPPALERLHLEIEEGEFVLVVGPSGGGKSTFLRALNGLVPHFYGGSVAGSVTVAGLDPVQAQPRGMAHTVGLVFQDPENQFVQATVEEELVFAMENFAVPQATMRKRVEEVLDQLNIAHLRERRLDTLSGGEQQRVAIGGVLTLQPRILALDEPTSQLDPQAAEEVLIALRQLNEDLGLTVICAEHRLERVVQYADRILYFPGQGAAPILDHPERVLAQIPLTPPLITLAKRLDWEPLPLTIKEGRRFARGMTLADPADAMGEKDSAPAATPLAALSGVWHGYNGHDALREVSLTIRPGQILAIMGRNGSGKTTLLKLLTGLLQPDQGKVTVAGQDTRQADVAQIIESVGYVPQQPAALLFSDSVAEELAFTRRSRNMQPDTAADQALLERLDIAHLAARNPRDLSVGEQQRAALAATLVARPPLLLLDEPTRGLDYANKARLRDFLRAERDQGRGIVLVTHDVELAAQAADRVVLLAEGEVILDGPVSQALGDSLIFAPQIHKLFRDRELMTVEDVLSRMPAVAEPAKSR